MRFARVGKQQMAREASSAPRAVFTCPPEWPVSCCNSSCRHKQLLTICISFSPFQLSARPAESSAARRKISLFISILFSFPPLPPSDILNVHHPWLILSQSKWVRPQSQMKVSRLRNLHIFAITHIMSCIELDEDNGRLYACLKWRRLPWASVICPVDGTLLPEKHDVLLLNIEVCCSLRLYFRCDLHRWIHGDSLWVFSPVLVALSKFYYLIQLASKQTPRPGHLVCFIVDFK